MAEFEKVLGSLGAEGLKNAAAQLLQRLYPALRASGAVESGEMSPVQNSGFDAGAWEKWAAGEEPGWAEGSRKGNAFPGLHEKRAGAAGAAEEAYTAGKSAARSSAGAAEAPKSADMRAVSDYFERDSRRYDREFERY